jgi:hypothetical protein
MKKRGLLPKYREESEHIEKPLFYLFIYFNFKPNILLPNFRFPLTPLLLPSSPNQSLTNYRTS